MLVGVAQGSKIASRPAQYVCQRHAYAIPQREWSLYQVRSSAVQAAHPSNNGLRVYFRETILRIL